MNTEEGDPIIGYLVYDDFDTALARADLDGSTCNLPSLGLMSRLRAVLSHSISLILLRRPSSRGICARHSQPPFG